MISNKHTISRWLEVYIGASLLIIVFASIVASLIIDHKSLTDWLDDHFQLLAVLAIAQCLAILLWMFKGGQRSKLWDWIPPMCMFRPAVWKRWLFVVLLIGGTIAGIIGMHIARSRASQDNAVTQPR